MELRDQFRDGRGRGVENRQEVQGLDRWREQQSSHQVIDEATVLVDYYRGTGQLRCQFHVDAAESAGVLSETGVSRGVDGQQEYPQARRGQIVQHHIQHHTVQGHQSLAEGMVKEQTRDGQGEGVDERRAICWQDHALILKHTVPDLNAAIQIETPLLASISDVAERDNRRGLEDAQPLDSQFPPGQQEGPFLQFEGVL